MEGSVRLLNVGILLITENRYNLSEKLLTFHKSEDTKSNDTSIEFIKSVSKCQCITESHY